ncbi:MAG: hypothetical protein ACKO6N_13310 [Myxococcota bacterium]
MWYSEAAAREFYVPIRAHTKKLLVIEEALEDRDELAARVESQYEAFTTSSLAEALLALSEDPDIAAVVVALRIGENQIPAVSEVLRLGNPNLPILFLRSGFEPLSLEPLPPGVIRLGRAVRPELLLYVLEQLIEEGTGPPE